MAAGSDRGVLFERAKDGALLVLEGLSEAGGDRATLILAGEREGGARVVFEQPTQDLDAVRRAVSEATVTDLATDLAGAVRAAAEVLGIAGAGGAAASGGGEIYVFSDFQASSLPAGEPLDAGPRAGLLLVATGQEGERAGGISVDAVQYGAARPMVGIPFDFRAVVRNHGPEPRSISLSLAVDGTPVSEKQVELEAGRGRVVRFTHRFVAPGWHRGEVRVSQGAGGSLPAAVRRSFALRAEERVHVLAINGAPSLLASRDELFFFRLALSAQPAQEGGEAAGRAVIVIDEAGAGDLAVAKLDTYGLVVLANVAEVPAAGIATLEHYVDQGGSLFVTLGDRVDVEAYNGWVGRHRLHGGLMPAHLSELVSSPAGELISPVGELAITGEELEDAGFVAWADERHPALAGFGPGELGSLASVRFRSRYNCRPGDAQVLMTASSGQGVLLERRFGQGRVVLFTSTIDRDWTNFPLQPTYVPWLYRMVSYLVQGQAGRGNFVRTGQVVDLPHSTTRLQPLEVERPDGSLGYGAPAASGSGTAAAFSETELAGVYEVRVSAAGGSGDPLFLFAANTPPEEAERWYLGREELESAAGETPVVYISDPESVREAGSLARQGHGLWNVLLAAALAVALFEPWLANRLSKRRASRAADAMSKRDVLPAVA